MIGLKPFRLEERENQIHEEEKRRDSG